MSGKQRLASILMSIVMLLGMAALSVSAEAPAADVYVSAGGGMTQGTMVLSTLLLQHLPRQ